MSTPQPRAASKETFTLPDPESSEEGTPQHTLLHYQPLVEAATKREQVCAAFSVLSKQLNFDEEKAVEFLKGFFGISAGAVKYHLASKGAWERASESVRATAAAKLPGRTRKLNTASRNAVVEFVKKAFEEHRMLLIDDIHEFVVETLKVDILRNTLARSLRDLPIKAAIAVPAESARLKINPETVSAYFDGLRVIDNTPAALVINIDESGQQDWADKRRLPCYVPASVCGKTVNMPVERSSTRSTLAVAISLSGELLKPLVIVGRKTVDNELIPRGYADDKVNYATSATSFINGAIFAAWIKDIVIKHVTEARERLHLDASVKAYVLRDGCNAHAETPEVAALLAAANVQFVKLPPHTSHLLQPLDVGIFGPQKRYRLTDRNQLRHLSAQSIHIIKTLDSLRKATCPSSIINSFRAAGIGTRLGYTSRGDLIGVAEVTSELTQKSRRIVEDAIQEQSTQEGQGAAAAQEQPQVGESVRVSFVEHIDEIASDTDLASDLESPPRMRPNLGDGRAESLPTAPPPQQPPPPSTPPPPPPPQPQPIAPRSSPSSTPALAPVSTPLRTTIQLGRRGRRTKK